VRIERVDSTSSENETLAADSFLSLLPEQHQYADSTRFAGALAIHLGTVPLSIWGTRVLAPNDDVVGGARGLGGGSIVWPPGAPIGLVATPIVRALDP